MAAYDQEPVGPPEFSGRARYVTERVSLWIQNDGRYIQTARRAARQGALADYLTGLMGKAYPSSAPWQVAQELAPNDYNRVDWQSIANDLLEEE